MRSVLLVVLSVLAFSASAKEKEGVNLPDTVTVEGKTLKLNGAGLRTKIFFKVYVAGLYLENPTHQASQVVSSDEVKRVNMAMLRDLNKHQIAEAMEEGFKKNSGDKMPALKERLEHFIGQLSDVKKGDQLLITYVPGKGTMVSSSAGEKTVIPGKDFADAMFSVWLGAHPVDDDLKKGMLGNP